MEGELFKFLGVALNLGVALVLLGVVGEALVLLGVVGGALVLLGVMGDPDL